MKKIKLTESELTQLIRNIIKEQHNLSYDEFLEEMLQRGQNLQKLVQVIRKGNPNEMASWDVRTQEKALGEFREVAEFTTDLINDFKPEVSEQVVGYGEQGLDEDAGRDTPGGNPDFFYGDGSLDKIRKFAEEQDSEMSKEDVIQELVAIYSYSQDGATDLVNSSLENLLYKLGRFN